MKSKENISVDYTKICNRLKQKNKTKIKKDNLIYKRGKFTPISEKEFKSLKIMFHKTLPKFHFRNKQRKNLSYAYCGSGFIALNMDLRCDLSNKYDMIDINSAYQHSLIKYEFPLSSEKEFIDDVEINYNDFVKKYKNKHYIALVRIYNVKAKYGLNDYNIYTKQLLTFNDKKGFFYYGWLCDIDLSNFKKLYNCKIIVNNVMFFNDFGLLGEKTNEFIYDKINKLNELERGTEERANYKTALHIATYGKSAQKINNYGIRSHYIPIAIYQAAYIRQYMINLYIKHKDIIAYCDSDSFIIKTGNLNKFDIGDKLGQFKICYENKKMYIARIKGYFIFDDKDNIIEQKWSGIKTKLTKKQVNDIIKCRDFEITEERVDENKKIIKQKIKIRNNLDKGYIITL